MTDHTTTGGTEQQDSEALTLDAIADAWDDEEAGWDADPAAAWELAILEGEGY